MPIVTKDKRERIYKALRYDNEQPTRVLAERFGVGISIINKCRREIGLEPPGQDGFTTIEKNIKTPERFTRAQLMFGLDR